MAAIDVICKLQVVKVFLFWFYGSKENFIYLRYYMGEGATFRREFRSTFEDVGSNSFELLSPRA